MTTLDLILALRELLQGELMKLELPVQGGDFRHVKCHALKLPSDDVLEESLYPLVFIEYLGGEDNAEISTTTLLFTIGNFATANQFDGVWDNLLIIEAVRESLLKNKLIGAASLQYPLQITSVESTADNFIFSEIVATYKIFSAEEDYLD